MNAAEYELMASVEPTHWWYVGLRNTFERVLHGVDRQNRLSGGSILDVGCGTGQNLRWLQDTYQPKNLEGFDLSPRAVEISQSVVPEAILYEADLCQPQQFALGPKDDLLDLIVCSDVLYATELEPAIEALRTLCGRLRSGGLFLLHLPAFNWLYSNHDVAVHTKHRFRKPEVIELLKQLGLNIKFISYRMFLMFPLVVLARLPSLMSGTRKRTDETTSDLQQPAAILNHMLYKVVAMENRMLSCGIRFPWGSSLIAVGSKT